MKRFVPPVVLAGVILLLAFGSGCNSLDFSKIRFFTTPKLHGVVSRPVSTASATVDMPARANLAVRERSDYYVDSARKDYFKGAYDEALAQLDRAKFHNPHNYGAHRLSGQIYFELENYYKAFDNWSRASQLPNDDEKINRDMTVLKQVIRYSRQEIIELKTRVNRNPNDRVALAQLEELERKMSH